MTKEVKLGNTTTGLQQVYGVDDGYAWVKAFGGAGVGQTVPARVEQGIGVSSLDGGTGGNVYETEGKAYSVGDGVNGEDTTFDGYHTSPLNRVAVHHALYAMGLGGQKISAVLGLPLRDYFVNNEKNERLIAEKIASFKIPVTKVGADPIIIGDVQIVPQGIAAVVDWGVDDKGNGRPEMKGDIAVVDIGGRTTDIAVVVGGGQIDHRRSGTKKDLGVLKVVDLLGESLRRKFGIEEDLGRAKVEAALRRREIEVWGTAYEIGELVDQAVGEVGAQIGRVVKERLGSGALLGRILFVGGGAVVFNRAATEYRNGEIPGEPAFANARGMYRFGRLAAAKKGRA